MSHFLDLIGDTPLVCLADDATPKRDEALTEARKIKTVEDAFDAECAADAMRQLKDLSRGVEDARKIVKEPVLKLGRQIDGLAKDFCEPLDAEYKRIGTLLGGYQRREKEKAEAAERKAREEAERIQREAENDVLRLKRDALANAKSEEDIAAINQKADEILDKAQIAAAETLAVSGPVKPKGTAVRTMLKFEVTNIEALYASHPECVRLEPNGEVIRALIKYNRNIPGLRVWEETTASIR